MSFADFRQMIVNVRPSKPAFTEKHYPDLSGKVYIVTGGPTGLGFEVSRLLAMQNAKVWLVARNESKIKEGIAKIKKEVPNAKLDYFMVDFSDLRTIKPGVQKFLDSETELHGVVHNAGVMHPPLGSKTEQGLELQLGVNCVGPFLLQKFLDDTVINTARTSPANSVRIVWVTAVAYIMALDSKLGVDWLAPASKFGLWPLYGRSKAVNIAQGILWPQYHADSGVVSVSVHPGFLRTELQRNTKGLMGRLIDSSLHEPIMGAYSELFGLLSPTLTTRDDGAYIIPYGKVGYTNKAFVRAMNGSRGKELWAWLTETTRKYL